MSTQTRQTEQQACINQYRKAHDNLDKIAAALEFLSRLTEADCEQGLELDTSQRIGLSALFSILSDQLSDDIYERMPWPDEFAKICNGKGGQAND